INTGLSLKTAIQTGFGFNIPFAGLAVGGSIQALATDVFSGRLKSSNPVKMGMYDIGAIWSLSKVWRVGWLVMDLSQVVGRTTGVGTSFSLDQKNGIALDLIFDHMGTLFKPGYSYSTKNTTYGLGLGVFLRGYETRQYFGGPSASLAYHADESIDFVVKYNQSKSSVFYLGIGIQI
ncbi:hypothetical protein HUU05_10225, partial [candidate division KSB1 bacterium]|nr:hypothetical protein [candidate division KSB1 bacterium]